MTKLSICQNDSTVNSEYPKIVIIEKDTLVIITPEHVDSINTTYITLDEYKKRDSINKDIINTYKYREDSIWKPIIEEKEFQLIIKDTIIDNKTTIIKNNKTIIEKKDDQIKNLKIKKVGSLILVVILGIIAI